MSTSCKSRSARLLEVVDRHPRLLIVSHDNPDPDALASGWALKWLIQERLGRTVRFVAGGDIVRAENRHMLRLLDVPIELLPSLPTEDDAAVVLVDCNPGAVNHLAAGGQPIVAVIDHHQTSLEAPPDVFLDIRPEVVATASIAASYLWEQGLEPAADLATAIIYAFRTETRGCETRHSRLDRRMISWLTDRADPSRLAEIENAPLSRNYYDQLVLALQNTFLYDDAAFCLLPRCDEPEIVGEIADLLIRCEGIHRVLCGAVYGGDVLLSVRTDPTGGNATELLQTAIDGLGHGGGHMHRAGGKLLLERLKGLAIASGTDALEAELRSRWLAACQVDRQRGTRLVRRREILEHLD